MSWIRSLLSRIRSVRSDELQHFDFVKCSSAKCGYVFAIHRNGPQRGKWEGPFIPWREGDGVKISFTFGDYYDGLVQYRTKELVSEWWADCKWIPVEYPKK